MPETCLLCGRVPSRERTCKHGIQVLDCSSCGIAFQKKISHRSIERYRGSGYFYSYRKDPSEEAGVRRVKRASAEWVLRRMKPLLPAGSRLLEVGSAFGYFLEAARDQGYRARGVEVSDAALEAQRRGLDILRVPFEELEEGAASYDAVVMLDVLEHFSDPSAAVAKAARFLSPGGLLAVITPDLGGLGHRVFGANWWSFHPEHLYYFSKKGLRGLLNKHGFTVVDARASWKGASFRYMANCGEHHKNAPRLVNRLLRALPFSRRPFLVPLDQFCLARRQGETA